MSEADELVDQPALLTALQRMFSALVRYSACLVGVVKWRLSGYG